MYQFILYQKGLVLQGNKKALSLWQKGFTDIFLMFQHLQQSIATPFHKK